MKSFGIMLTSINDVKQFVNAASMQSCEIDVVSGRYTIDAKSIMGIFSIDLSKPLQVEVQGTEEEYQKFYEAVSRFVVKI